MLARSAQKGGHVLFLRIHALLGAHFNWAGSGSRDGTHMEMGITKKPKLQPKQIEHLL
jgi:hypothetical protein